MIKGIRAGHENSYARLFQMYYRPLSVFAVKYVNDLETAKEIVQDLFVHLYENRHTIEISTSLESYLFQSVRNRSLNHLKRLKVQRKHFEHLSFSQESTEDLEAAPAHRCRGALRRHPLLVVAGLAVDCLLASARQSATCDLRA